MNLRTILGFLVGRADAIRHVASSKAAFWTGMALVLLTAFPRNYDQTYIPEKPVLWFLGPLLFSLASGTWLFLISYGLCARRTMADADGRKPPLWPTWRGFIGAFWMTAPIAWIYAIPVERFWDSLTATKANLWLLGIVSLWRVLLMARVLNVVCQGSAWLSLLWVLVPAAIEVLVVVFFGGTFAKQIMSGMGGMRNSPEESLVLGALGAVFGLAFWGTPVLLLLLGIFRRHGNTVEWPKRVIDGFPKAFLLGAAAFWIAVTVPCQRELRNNWTVEQHIAKGEMRAALDFLNHHEPDDFAPAREIPPKTHEWKMPDQLAGLMRVLLPSDAAWVHHHFLQKLAFSLSTERGRNDADLLSEGLTEDELQFGMEPWFTRDAAWPGILHGLQQSDEGKQWVSLQTNLWLQVFKADQPPDPSPISTNSPPTP